jgi:hypothetical protein
MAGTVPPPLHTHLYMVHPHEKDPRAGSSHQISILHVSSTLSQGALNAEPSVVSFQGLSQPTKSEGQTLAQHSRPFSCRLAPALPSHHALHPHFISSLPEGTAHFCTSGPA